MTWNLPALLLPDTGQVLVEGNSVPGSWSRLQRAIMDAPRNQCQGSKAWEDRPSASTSRFEDQCLVEVALVSRCAVSRTLQPHNHDVATDTRVIEPAHCTLSSRRTFHSLQALGSATLVRVVLPGTKGLPVQDSVACHECVRTSSDTQTHAQ
jgi:hypothetical protein